MRTFFFILFFSIGAASLGVSVLCEDLIQYYQNRQLARGAEESLEKLKSLNDDYDVLLKSISEEDPNLVKRIAPAALGNVQQDSNTVYPRATAEQLAAARRALTEPNKPAGESPTSENTEPAIPRWLSRCSKPVKRMAIFFSGITLILISFICFGPAKKTN
jgi:hypothetical protein